MATAKIYCEITCNSCGALLKGSGYYKNTSVISNLRRIAKENNWIWDEKFGGNLCSECQEELKKSN